jgi:hypothetical protein
MKALRPAGSTGRIMIGLSGAVLLAAGLTSPVGVADAAPATHAASTAHFAAAKAFDKSAPLRTLARQAVADKSVIGRMPAERGAPGARKTAGNRTFTGDAAVQRSTRTAAAADALTATSFEGLSNQDNFNAYGGRVNPPDTVGDVGPHHYVEMINLLFAVYSKAGATLLGPTPIGSLWSGFAVPDCTDPPATRSSSTTNSSTAGS